MPGVGTVTRIGRGRVLLATLIALAAPASVVTPAQAISATDGELIVRFADGTSRAESREVVADADASIEQRLAGRSALVEVEAGQSTAAAIAELEAQAEVLYAEPNFEVRATALSNDSLLTSGSLWNILKIAAPDAWDTTTGAGTVVAVLDSGIDAAHPDLAGQTWTNPREAANGVDDDGNGFIDDVTGADWVRGDGEPDDEEGHGTHVSGTVAAAANDGNPAVGVAPGAKVMALKFLDGNGAGSVADAISAVDYAVTNGATVINASWGGPDYSRALNDAMARAGAAGVVVAAAAGNEASNNDTGASYPANFNLGNLISVGAIDRRGRLASFSNYGQSVDLAAPGSNIISTVNLDYEAWSGTSMAAPHVAGVAALVRSVAPAASADEVAAAIVNGATSTASLSGRIKDGNVLSATGALAAITGAPASEPGSAPSPFKLRKPGRRVSAGRNGKIRFSWTRAVDSDFKSYKVYIDGRLKAEIADPDGSGPMSAATSARVKVSAGRHRWSVVATDLAGNTRRASSGRYRGRIAVVGRRGR